MVRMPDDGEACPRKDGEGNRFGVMAFQSKAMTLWHNLNMLKALACARNTVTPPQKRKTARLSSCCSGRDVPTVFVFLAYCPRALERAFLPPLTWVLMSVLCPAGQPMSIWNGSVTKNAALVIIS